jgi:ribosomal protein S18 acetylase RimI-like enzyme
MPHARLAQAADLASLLELYRVADVSSSAEPIERAERIWLEMLAHDGVALFVSELNTQIIACCMLITAPNLLRAGQRHGFLENVVTHPEFQGQGHGRAVVEAALAEAWSRDCYHVLLQSGRKDPRVHRRLRRAPPHLSAGVAAVERSYQLAHAAVASVACRRGHRSLPMKW